MEIIDFNTEIKEKCVVTTGNFDGVHNGHQKVLTLLNSVSDANGYKKVLFTFDRHPRLFFNPDLSHYVLTPLMEKINILQDYVDYVIPIPFTKVFSTLTPLDYMKHLKHTFSIEHYIAGYDHHIGRNKDGSFENLKKIADDLHIMLDRVEPFLFDNLPASSSRIKQMLECGNTEDAAKLLGYHYRLKGEVIHGRELGRTIGFPTANLNLPHDKYIPAQGVYIAKLCYQNRIHGVLLNIGTNPTITESRELSVEAHILNFEKMIYGETIEIEIGPRIRDEQKFIDIEELKRSLDDDKREGIKMLQSTFSLSCS